MCNNNKDIKPKIEKAFEIFELGTVSKISSKLIPFRSLHIANNGDIARVTPEAYKKLTERESAIEILEDFPEELNIQKVNIEQLSCLGKVIKKTRTIILISRYGAYAK